ncbi:CBO0543 family protein [Cytobacillus pseudoceanisediminis]|uniref:CBO0543 family protein n=1 Tax=Cytobacillus TaxID=2675230 RepID=UPI0021175EC3|nr:CBO0543 family protein [Cytobacillus sp. Bac17]
MQTSLVVFFIIVSLLFGAWKRLNEFYPTLLFWIIGDLLYASLLHDFRVWEFRPVWIDHFILPTHTIIATAIAFLIYPSVIVVYLGRFPKTNFKRIGWVVFWALIFEGIELIAYFNGSIIHQYGWTLAYSFLFNIITFSLLAIHKWKPWAAWALAFFSILLLWIIFDPPLPQ